MPAETRINIEEKLEALTHSVELLATMRVEGEKRMILLAGQMEELADRSTRLQEHMASLATGMATLTRVTLEHSERMERLEMDKSQ